MALDIDKKSILENLVSAQKADEEKAAPAAEVCDKCGAPKSAWAETEPESGE